MYVLPSLQQQMHFTAVLVILLGIILFMHSANERCHYIAMLALIGWAHIQNDPCPFIFNIHDERINSNYS